jgi:hypothetical protein
MSNWRTRPYQRALLQFDYAGEPLLAFHETLGATFGVTGGSSHVALAHAQAVLIWPYP